MPWIQPSHYDRSYRAASQRAARRRYDEATPEIKQFRSCRAWTQLSKAYRAAHPICEHCEKRIALHTHHREKLSTPEGWIHRYDWTGLMAVCRECHDELDG